MKWYKLGALLGSLLCVSYYSSHSCERLSRSVRLIKEGVSCRWSGAHGSCSLDRSK